MAATGTPTPNIGLRIPLGTDPASVDDINYNSNLIDTKLGAVGNDSVQDQIDDLNSKITPIDGHLKSANLLYTFEGTSQQSVTLAASAQNYYFVMALLLNGANTVIGTAFVNPVIANNRNVQIFGSDSSTWGSFMLTDNGTKCTFNRTSATTQSILLYGISLTLDN